PDTGAIVFGRHGTRIETPLLRELARRAAADLQARGVTPGTPVAGLIDNSLEFLALWWGAAYAGAEFVPINTRLRGDSVRHVVERTAPALLLAQPAGLDLARSSVGPDREVLDATRWLAGLDGYGMPRVSAEGGGCVIFTSGTTGRPKGVRLPSETQVRHARAYSTDIVRLDAHENSYTCLPLFHVTAVGVTMATLIHGGTVHVDERFSVSRFWQRMAETGAVLFPYVGSILSLLLKDDRPVPRHQTRVAIGGAAPEQIFRPFEQRFGVELLETYGQTELGGIWLVNHERVPGSIGRPCPRAEARVVPVDGVPAGRGELQFRPYDRWDMMAGYLDPRETAEVFDGDWYRTRDLVEQRPDGSYRFVGRLSDCIRRRGENVSAFEVELALLRHPAVAEVAAVGVDSDLGEQDIAVYYRLKPTARVGPAELRAWAADHLGDFMLPRYLREVDDLPKTETQRVRKPELVARIGLAGAYDAERADAERDGASAGLEGSR
ncbi:MAG TPA: AMP-binding protein, partial [Micromonospora sp.]